jgi:ATP-dependent Clp protease adaptor protein ClpS
MAEKSKKSSEESNTASGGGTATAKPKKARKAGPKPTPTKQPPGLLPPWKVLLHNDNKNALDFVIGTIVELTPLNEIEAKVRTTEADKTGVALLLVTHKERAELYQEQFQSKGLTVTIEPAEQS